MQKAQDYILCFLCIYNKKSAKSVKYLLILLYENKAKWYNFVYVIEKRN